MLNNHIVYRSLIQAAKKCGNFHMATDLMDLKSSSQYLVNYNNRETFLFTIPKDWMHLHATFYTLALVNYLCGFYYTEEEAEPRVTS